MIRDKGLVNLIWNVGVVAVDLPGGCETAEGIMVRLFANSGGWSGHVGNVVW